MSKFKQSIQKFFFPPVTASRWIKVLPYAVLGVLTLIVVVGSSYGWAYTNSDPFCGTTCHTMPPQYNTYLKSPHANVTCSECHIGRAFIASQILRKAQDVREIIAMTFATYEYPLFATRLRPATETCEKCHLPEKFSNDSLVVNAHYASDQENSEESTYLILKTGGGTAREGLGLGIHWHISNKVEYYSTDELSQNIPYIRVYNADGTTTEFTDIEAGFNPESIADSELKQIDCVTCHNRVSHQFLSPTQAMDSYLQRGLIDAAIPNIHTKGVEVLSVKYSTYEDAKDAIAGLETFYQDTYPNEFS
ncbi:MAG: NapC/NirT family cytochrome c, partial [Clostridia bacterium]|nr:NapC/NirT family cytochrome c [Clostridia bacterium]